MICANGPPAAKPASRNAIGTISTTIVAPTRPIGKSRSVRSSDALPPEPRWRDAAMAPAIPRTIGRITRSSVQIAATPIVPAPMKRTLARNTLDTNAAISVPGGGPLAVIIGRITTKLITMPTSMAMPTASPTKCPTPTSASEKPAENVVPPAPSLVVQALPSGANFSLVIKG